jgi:hypothetical protein
MIIGGKDDKLENVNNDNNVPFKIHTHTTEIDSNVGDSEKIKFWGQPLDKVPLTTAKTCNSGCSTTGKQVYTKATDNRKMIEHDHPHTHPITSNNHIKDETSDGKVYSNNTLPPYVFVQYWVKVR